MIRRFNYTGRKKILRSRISVRTSRTTGGLLSFDADMDFEGLSLPVTGKVFVEAYRRAYFRRFPCGTAFSLRPSRETVLDGIDPGTLVIFRVKVVDRKGRIVAAADRIIPKRAEEEPADRFCLLPVEFVDLGHAVWRLDLESDWPCLQLNSRVDQIRETARSDPSFLVLVYPEIVRQILYRIVVEEDHNDPGTDPDDWMSRWLRFVLDLSGRGVLPPCGESEPVLQEKLRWIDDAVEAFCSHHQVLEKFMQSEKGDG